LGEDFSVSILACNDTRIAGLNGDFRGKPQPTNVLSWPATDLSAEQDGATPHPPETDPDGPDEAELGDIALAYETCVKEAADQQKTLDHHLTHLIIHASLHLLGYDHIRDRDATLMESMETAILGKMGIADPYRVG
jgi:probable rRNA maturation factor